MGFDVSVNRVNKNRDLFNLLCTILSSLLLGSVIFMMFGWFAGHLLLLGLGLCLFVVSWMLLVVCQAQENKYTLLIEIDKMKRGGKHG